MKVVILLDGSPETLLASTLAISLAEATKAESLIGITVTETSFVMELTGYCGGPGLCGSGIFIAAYEAMLESLSSVCESLQMSFRARAEGAAVNVDTCHEFGDSFAALNGRIAGTESVLVLPSTKSVKSMLARNRFSTPTIVVAGHGACIDDIAILGTREDKRTLKSLIRQLLPHLPLEFKTDVVRRTA